MTSPIARAMVAAMDRPAPTIDDALKARARRLLSLARRLGGDEAAAREAEARAIRAVLRNARRRSLARVHAHVRTREAGA